MSFPDEEFNIDALTDADDFEEPDSFMTHHDMVYERYATEKGTFGPLSIKVSQFFQYFLFKYVQKN